MITPQYREKKSLLQENWPPKWFLTYADLATLTMTFFIVLATMLALNIPLSVLADKKMQKLIAEEAKKLEEVTMLTEREKKVLKELQDLEVEQIESIIQLEKLKAFAEDIRRYIKINKLEDFISVEEGKWKVKIVPLVPFLFAKGKAVLNPEAEVFLDKIAEFLKKYPSYIKIEGHTDNIPIKNPLFPSNWELSIARANSVLRYFLEKHKIPIERIEAIGYGEYRPKFPNDTEENRAKNRRVVLEISPLMEKDFPNKQKQPS